MRSNLEYRRRDHNGYFDEQPELQTVVRDWLQTLKLDRWSMAFTEPKLEDIECRSRDGFIAHSHNRGGFDLEYMSDVNSCNGSGCGPSLAAIDTAAEWAYTTAKEIFLKDRAEELNGVPEDKVNYHDLHEIGLPRLAEDLSELESELMHDGVWWGVRAMYEGADTKGVHTLMLYCSGNVSEYYGFCGQGSTMLAEFEIRFRTAGGLARQLKRLTRKVEGAF